MTAAATRWTTAEYDRLRQVARMRAHRRLAKEHPEEFDLLHDEEREALGLPALRRRGE